MRTALQQKTLVLVDGTYLAYRSHFAFINRPLTTRKGEVTSAVYGFIIGLRKILQDLKPDYVAVVFDPPGETFRHELYEHYKGTRERMPEDLSAQFPWIDRYLDAAGIPRLAIRGVEADDVLATLGLRASEQGIEARIVSNDKDLAQMVNGGIVVVTMSKPTEPPRLMRRAEVQEVYGVPPEKIVDLLSLVGDSSDNVPGIPGVGLKTAAKLLTEHGTLEEVFAAAPAMKPGKLRDGLLAGRDTCLFSRSLIRLKTDVELGIEPESLALRAPQDELLNALYEELEFHTLKKEPPAARPSEMSGYRKIETLGEVRALAERLAQGQGFAFATKVTSADPMRAELVGLAIGDRDGEAAYLPLAHLNSENLPWAETREILRPVFASESPVKWGHNIKSDLVVLRRHGLDVRGIDFDTMLASYAIDASRRSHGLNELAHDRMGVRTMAITDLVGSGRNQISIAQAPVGDVAKQAAECADLSFRLRRSLEPDISAFHLEKLLNEIELPLIEVLADMEMTGVRLDGDFLRSLSTRMAEELSALEAAAWEAAGDRFSLGSPKQVGEILFGKLGLKPRRKTKTGLSTDAETLEELREDHAVVGLLLRHREVSKLKSTYVDALPALVHPETGRLHTNYSQAGSTTGRLSSSEPNLQNVPVRTQEGRAIRKAFIPSIEGGALVSCDYSQIELRILAHMAQDENLLDAFRRDVDVHRATAAIIFGGTAETVGAEQRAQAKTINFAVIYGMGPVNLGRTLNITTKEASRWIEAYFARSHGIRAFIERTKAAARHDLFVETLSGRRRPVPEVASPDHRTRAFGERIAVNTPIQGTAADILKIAMIRVHRALARAKMRSKMILTVHDELVFDAPGDEVEELKRLVAHEMENAMPLSVPLKVETGSGPNWSEAH
jgi:DNA polymerase-1